ncbi:MAG TPA: hypothetical protein VFS24_01215 [Steroidobacteraceae bacterium]|nr:hypothetical protein [Steroidobacteraceae bacterium]
MGHIKAHWGHLHQRDLQRATAALIVLAAHVGLYFVIVNSGGRFEGIHDSATPITRLILLLSRDAQEKRGAELPIIDPQPQSESSDWLKRSVLVPAVTVPPERSEPTETAAAIVIPRSSQRSQPPPADLAHLDVPPHETPVISVQFTESENRSLLKRLSQLAEAQLGNPQQQVTWRERGRQYTAKLAIVRASHGSDLDRALAQVSAEDKGRQLTTQIKLKRLAFSNYTQMIDTWDPMVQLHDDEIVGRLHINSEFNLMADSDAAPHFLGKVSTAASSFTTASVGRRKNLDMFRDGIETHAGRITLPRDVRPFAWTPQDERTRIRTLRDDTHIEFFADGSYSLDEGTGPTQRIRDDGDRPVYFIGSRGATLYVKGVVAGKVLVYSPQRIVVEGSITYAHDPRKDAQARDYLGLVSDRTVELARSSVTGDGDLEIDAAIYAGRRFLVTDIYTARQPATLRIYGSVAAGSMSATEPRYSTKIEYDTRFEEVRPPGFPSTNRFVVEAWNERWTEATQ